MRGEAVFHAEEQRVPRQVGVVAEDALIVEDSETVAVNHHRCRIESIGLAVQPVTFRLIGIDLVLDRDIA